MEVHFTPELQAKLEKLATETGRTRDELVRDAVLSYFEELTVLRQTLDGRFQEIKTGQVKAVDGEDVFAQLQRKSESRRADERMCTSSRSCRGF